MGRFEMTAAVGYGAKRPWSSLDAMNVSSGGRPIEIRKTYGAEQWEIDACLHCPYPECHNCFDAWKTAFSNIRYDTHKARKKKRKRNARI